MFDGAWELLQEHVLAVRVAGAHARVVLELDPFEHMLFCCLSCIVCLLFTNLRFDVLNSES